MMLFGDRIDSFFGDYITHPIVSLEFEMRILTIILTIIYRDLLTFSTRDSIFTF